MHIEKTWEENQLNFIKLMNGQIKKVRNKITGQLIEVNDDGSVRVYQADGSYKDFENLKKAIKFHWEKFHGKEV